MAEKTIYFLSENNLKVSGLGVEDIVQQLDPEISLVIGGVDSCPLVNDGLIQYSSLVDLSLSIMRELRVLKNDRILLRCLESLAIASSLAIGTKQKELFGDFDINVSDVLEVFSAISRHSRSNGALEIRSQEAKDILASEKGSNLINSWTMLMHLTSTERDDILTGHKNVLIIFHPDWFSENRKSPDFDLYKILFGSTESKKKQVVIETPLDASFTEFSASAISFGIVALSTVNDLSLCEPSPVKQKSRSAQQCLQIVESYLRLLVNSRDELSLASIICGPTGMVDEKDFTFIKNEAKKTKMPLFQTLTSFANKVKLGGQCLANLHDHPFAPFQKQIVDFTNLMDKLQVKIEDSKCPMFALAGVAGVLRSHLSSKMKPSVVTEVTDILPTLLERLTKRRDVFASQSTTPKRDISSGGSMVGMRNVLAIRQIVDFWSSAPLRNRTPNIHVLLGKIEDSEGTSPTLLPNVMTLFKSPVPLSDEDLLEQINKTELPTVSDKIIKPGRPKFEASLAWATDSSPIVYQSPIPVSAPVDDADQSCSPKLKLLKEAEPSYLTKGREQANKILKETRVEMRKIAKQFPKRSIIGEINNLLKFPKKDVESFFDTKRKPTDVFVDTKKKTTDVFVDNDDTASEPPSKKAKGMNEPPTAAKKPKEDKPKKPKAVGGKKAIAQIKGQSKITAFLRV